MHKVLRSAVANAETTEGLDTHDLVVSVAQVDEGPTMKRWRPRAQGRATRINKRTSHITLVVQPASEVAVEPPSRRRRRRPRRPPPSAAAPRRPPPRRPPAKKATAKKTTTKKTAAKKAADTTGEDA